MNDFVAERLTESAIQVTFYNVASGNLPRVLLTGDRHHDSPACNRRLELKHLEEARKTGAAIIDIGDMFDAMQGKYDPRKTYSGMRPEYNKDEYLDSLWQEASEFYSPYADNFVLIGQGNHEFSVLNHNHMNLPKAVVRELNRAASKGKGPFYGEYAGWVLLRFNRKGKTETTLPIKYHHGYGGGGPVTKGVIQTNRRAVYLPDAAVIATAHIHEAWALPIIQERISQKGVSRQRAAWHISVPTYQDDYGDGTEGFHIRKGRPPKPMGCVWLDFEFYDKGRRLRIVPKLNIAQEA